MSGRGSSAAPPRSGSDVVDTTILISSEWSEAEMGAMALGNALVIRACGTGEAGDAAVLSVLDEVYDLLSGPDGDLLTHVQAAERLAPVLDRLLARIAAAGAGDG